jgi:hypothetical protein
MNARLPVTLVMLLVASTGLGCVAISTAPPPDRGQEKVLVCHKGKNTLEVAAPAVDAHLRHGDTRGPCR